MQRAHRVSGVASLNLLEDQGMDLFLVWEPFPPMNHLAVNLQHRREGEIFECNLPLGDVLHIRGDGTTQRDRDLSLEPKKK